jgi:Raf kinase inhibitor-like YbhB/YbcL family protein
MPGARILQRRVRTIRARDNMALKLTSPAFQHDGPIPEIHTCDGGDAPPPLEWSGKPEGTKSFALIVDDPDAPDPKAPQTTYVHWVLYDIPASIDALVAGGSGLPDGAHEGINDFKRRGYGGPCPPVGRHRYFFKLYALDIVLGSRGPLTKAELETAMRDHLLDQAELVGTYERNRAAASQTAKSPANRKARA